MIRVRRRILLVAAVITTGAPIHARAQAAGRSIAPPVAARLAVRADRLVDVRAGTVVRDAVVLIEGNRITAVGRGLAVPAGVRVIDLGALTVLPGLVDAHTHLLHEYHRENGGDEENRILEVVKLGPSRRALLGARIAREMLEAGFTTVRDLGNSGVDGAVALRDAVASGWVTGPRIIAAGRALAPVGGQFERMTREAQALVVEQEYVQVSGADEARRAVRQSIYEGADWIKVIVNVGPRVLSLEELRAIVDEARRAGRSVAAHATQGDGPALLAAEADVASIEHAYTVSDTVLRLMAAKGIVLVPTDAPGVARYQARIQRALRAGVRIAIGSDLYYADSARTRGMASAGMYAAYVTAGMRPADLLR
ncbi:MAG TPA: amidohydrolase family protein, partial [Gemmatimonadaceae bacterium]|nr:amidohydrolase family protein [Gemmatimonadaceae bacterium]